MKGASPIRLDFAAPVHRAPLAGVALAALGLAAALGLGAAFRGEVAERERLDAALGSASAPRHRTPPPEALAAAGEESAVAQELGVPWTRLLAELEAASHDTAATVSLLQIVPDPGKRRVRITAEVRGLNDALGFVKRLQQCDALRDPMLESHERRKDDPEHPLRVTLSAEWRT